MEKTVIAAAKRGDAAALRQLLPLAEYPFYYRWNHPLGWAAYYGHLDAFRVVLFDRGFRETADLEGCLVVAAKQGHINIVDFILTFTDLDPTFNENEALTAAIAAGELEVVKRMLSDPRIRGLCATCK